MNSSNNRDVELLFVALHQASLQCSKESFLRYQMSRGLYFYDQNIRVSRIGGIHRYKRHPDELNQALHHLRVALANDDDQPSKTATATPTTTINATPSPVKQQLGKQNEHLIKKIEKNFERTIIPDLLFKELDGFFQQYDDKPKTGVSSSTPSLAAKSATTTNFDSEQDQETILIQEVDDEDELIIANSNTPKISLPGSLIIQLHSTWNDLIENTEYTYQTWKTKHAEDSWRRHCERKRLEQSNSDKQRSTLNGKVINRRQSLSRGSIASIGNQSRLQQTLVNNNQIRSNRSLSRVSFLSPNNPSPLDHQKLTKQAHQTSSESLNESIKSGIHVEFKLSIQIDQTKQEQQAFIQQSNLQKGVMFDVPKLSAEVQEDMIQLIQEKCKRILAETKQKILNTTGDINDKMCKVWFYGENQHIRSKTNILTLNESAKKQRSKFLFALLRREIPEKYEISINIPENKHKSYLELIDGSIQVYYPSGRLSMLRTSSPNAATILFDDVDSEEEKFLGVVTSTGGAVIVQPTLHARFVTDITYERAYLCNGKTGLIEKQIQWHSKNPISQQTISNDEDDSLPPLLENVIQFQLNNSMQFEYHNPTNIRFAFATNREEFKFQLGTNLSTQLPLGIDVNHFKKVPEKKKTKNMTTAQHINHLNEILSLSEKQQIQVERLLDGQVNIRELPMFRELTTLRKRIRNICNNWLKTCRHTLGVMDIESYCLSDWTSSSNKLIPPIRNTQPSKSAKSPRHVTIARKFDSSNDEFPQPNEREEIIRTLSARKPEENILTNTIMEFTPRSDSAKAIKQRFNAKKKLSPLNFPSNKRNSIPIIIEENASPHVTISVDLPFACPNLIRQRLIEDGPISPILYDNCQCRADQVPIIHDLEFDTFIQLTKQLNSKQLIVIGIINSNLRQIENEQQNQSNDLYEILQTLNYHFNYGRSQISSCRLSMNDDYRCLLYDLSQATKQSSLYGPLLVRRHHVQPGFVLIYQNGRLIFGDSIFNGYGKDVNHLKKQLNRMKQQHFQPTPLPDQFKFITDHGRTNSAALKSV